MRFPSVFKSSISMPSSTSVDKDDVFRLLFINDRTLIVEQPVDTGVAPLFLAIDASGKCVIQEFIKNSPDPAFEIVKVGVLSK
jgi:hypothetical protein